MKIKHNIMLTLVIAIICVMIITLYGRLYKTDDRIKKILDDTRISNHEIINDYTSNYQLDNSFFDNSLFSSPAGVLVEDSSIYITDSSKNCVYVFDLAGSLLKTIGTTGNGNMQFLQPHQIRCYDNLFYILDSGNNRIQVYSKEFEYEKTIKLIEFIEWDFGEENDFAYCDMAFDKEGNIFVSALAMQSHNTRVLRIDKQGIVTQLGDELVGYLASINGEIYFANHKTAITGLQNGKANTYYLSHENYLYKLIDGKLDVLSELPFKYDTVNFTYDNNYLYLSSYSLGTLDKFSVLGQYIGTIYVFDTDAKIRYMYYDEVYDFFIATSAENGIAFFLSNKN